MLEKKFLVIGSNSFTGSHFIDFLIKKDYQCLGVSRSKEKPEEFLAYKWNKDYKKKFKFKKIDLNKDIEELVEIISKEKISYIVNFAAQSMVGQSWIYPEDWYKTNLVSTSKFLNRIKDLDFIKSYVSVTTPEVYGSTKGWVTESFNFNPSTPYAISRAAQDLHLKSLFDSFSFPVKFTRAANVYGPGQSLYRIIPRTFLEGLDKGKLVLDGGGVSKRVFIHAQDVADATLKIALKGKNGSTYHISGNMIVSIKKLVKLICEVIDVDFNELVESGPDRIGKDNSYFLNSNKLITELNWKEKISLKEGLDQTYSWVRDNFSFLKKHPRDYKHKK